MSKTNLFLSSVANLVTILIAIVLIVFPYYADDFYMRAFVKAEQIKTVAQEHGVAEIGQLMDQFLEVEQRNKNFYQQVHNMNLYMGFVLVVVGFFQVSVLNSIRRQLTSGETTH